MKNLTIDSFEHQVPVELAVEEEFRRDIDELYKKYGGQLQWIAKDTLRIWFRAVSEMTDERRG